MYKDLLSGNRPGIIVKTREKIKNITTVMSIPDGGVINYSLISNR
jgi:hypothetical protein